MSATPRKMMGMVTGADQKVPVTVRDWNAMKLAMWRCKIALGIIERAAAELVPQCRHIEGCPGAEDNSEPCIADTYETVTDIKPDLPAFNPAAGADYVDNRTDLSVRSSTLVSSGCPDRELRMSLLVILGASRQLAPVNARAPSGEMYMAPSRERYGEVMAELGAAQLQNEVFREELKKLAIDPDQFALEKTS